MEDLKTKQIFDLELRISKFLRYGVLVSLLLLSIGWIGQLIQGSADITVFQTYQQVSLHEHLQLLIDQASYFKLIAYLGLFVLIALPVSRVLLTGILFVSQKENILAGLAFLVLFFLAVSFTMGIEL